MKSRLRLGGWNLKMKSRLKLKVCEARQVGWNLMKSRLRLKVCEARQGGGI